MEKAAIFIDLPNFYSRLLKSGLDKPGVLKDYFLHWLDFDLLASSLVDSYSGVWAFYSGEKIGPSGNRISGMEFQQYIQRINALRGVTARNVNIPGEQREPISYKCSNCQHEDIAESVSEKGIDSSITVHLFDTIDSWDIAYLLSGDADFVPVVESLRRRGKIVVGVGFPDASSALVRECYDYININDAFIGQDLLLYEIFSYEGIAFRWLNGEVKPCSGFVPSGPTWLSIAWRQSTSKLYRDFQPNIEEPSYYITFDFKGSIDLSDRVKALNDLSTKLGKYGNFNISEEKDGKFMGCDISDISIYPVETVNRKFDSVLASLKGLSDRSHFKREGSSLVVNFVYNEKTNKLEYQIQ